MATLSGSLPVVQANASVYALTSTGRTLADEVLRIIQDASYTHGDVIALFNDCLMEIAGSHLLPELETMREVSTKTNSNQIALPADYHHNLRYCHSITYHRQVRIFGSPSLLARRFSHLDQNGCIIGVSIIHRNLYYQRIPSSPEKLMLNYYRYPQRLVTPEDKPICLPWHLAKKLLKSYALKELYGEIEDDEQGKVNTIRYDKKYELALAELLVFIGPEEDIADEFEEEIDWESMA